MIVVAGESALRGPQHTTNEQVYQLHTLPKFTGLCAAPEVHQHRLHPHWKLKRGRKSEKISWKPLYNATMIHPVMNPFSQGGCYWHQQSPQRDPAVRMPILRSFFLIAEIKIDAFQSAKYTGLPVSPQHKDLTRLSNSPHLQVWP